MAPDRARIVAGHPVRAAARVTRPALCLSAVALGLAACGPSGPVEEPELVPGTSSVEYPTDLWDAGMEGEAIVMVRVTEAGTVDSVYVEESSGHAAFDSAAVRGCREMRFAPATQGGERIAMWTRVPIRFRLEATEPTDARVPAAAGRDTGQAGHDAGHD